MSEAIPWTPEEEVEMSRGRGEAAISELELARRKVERFIDQRSGGLSLLAGDLWGLVVALLAGPPEAEKLTKLVEGAWPSKRLDELLKGRIIAAKSLDAEPRTDAHFTVEELRRYLADGKSSAAWIRRLGEHLIRYCAPCLEAVRAVGAPVEEEAEPMARALRAIGTPQRTALSPQQRWALRRLDQGDPLAFPRLVLAAPFGLETSCAGNLRLDKGIVQLFRVLEADHELGVAFAPLALAAADQLEAAELSDLRGAWMLRASEQQARSCLLRPERLWFSGDDYVESGSGSLELQGLRAESLGRVEWHRGFHLRAIERLEEAAELYGREADLAERRAEVLCQVGSFHQRTGRIEEAVEAVDRSRESLEPLGSEVSRPLDAALKRLSEELDQGLGGDEEGCILEEAQVAYNQAMAVFEPEVSSSLFDALLSGVQKCRDEAPKIPRGFLGPKRREGLTRCRQLLEQSLRDHGSSERLYQMIAEGKLEAVNWLLEAEESES